MKRGNLVAIVLGIVLGIAGLQAADGLKAVTESYLEIHAQLAADKFDAVKPTANALAEKAAGMGDSGAPIVKAAKTLGEAADIKAARDAFGPLSDAVIAAAKAAGFKDLGEVNVGFCPMVKKSWLQKDDAIKNPYYGSLMLSCGELKKP